MKVESTGIAGLLLITPQTYADARGFFLESFQRERYRDAGIIEDFVQDNHSRSARHVLRGLHFQICRPQAQIVSILRGTVFDVAVDLRRDSATFGRWYGLELSDRKQRQIYMAPGIAHGFCVLSELADLHYKVSQYYDAGDEGSVIWNDPDIGVEWPISDPILAPKDAASPRLRDLPRDRLPHLAKAQG